MIYLLAERSLRNILFKDRNVFRHDKMPTRYAFPKLKFAVILRYTRARSRSVFE
jgi:hypothetical protein